MFRYFAHSKKVVQSFRSANCSSSHPQRVRQTPEIRGSSLDYPGGPFYVEAGIEYWANCMGYFANQVASAAAMPGGSIKGKVCSAPRRDPKSPLMRNPRVCISSSILSCSVGRWCCS